MNSLQLKSKKLVAALLAAGVLGGAGMERFDDLLSEQDADNIHAYLIDQSWIAYRAQQADGKN